MSSWHSPGKYPLSIDSGVSVAILRLLLVGSLDSGKATDGNRKKISQGIDKAFWLVIIRAYKLTDFQKVLVILAQKQ